MFQFLDKGHLVTLQVSLFPFSWLCSSSWLYIMALETVSPLGGLCTTISVLCQLAETCRLLRQVPKISPLGTSGVALSPLGHSVSNWECFTVLTQYWLNKMFTLFAKINCPLECKFLCQATYWVCQKNPESVAWLLSLVPMQVATGMLWHMSLLHSHQHCEIKRSSF